MDIRPCIKAANKNIGSVVCRLDGSLQICYYQEKDKAIMDVSCLLMRKSLLQCFTRLDFIKTPSPEPSQTTGVKK